MSARRELKIGIDARAATEVPAGRGRVVRELLRALAARPDDGHRFLLYGREPWQDKTLDGRFAARSIMAGDPVWHLAAALRANRECDAFLSTNSYLTTWFLRIPAVPIVYDLVAFEPGAKANRRSAAIERATLGLAVRRSARLLSISQATADALAERFPRAAGRTVVAPLGVAPALASELDQKLADDLPAAGFVLAVGTLEPRKNLPRLVAAYQQLDSRLQAQHPLVVVGPQGWEIGETLSALASLRDRCIVLGYVPDQALAELYRRCALFCYPSLAEGFGLPVLEAMAAGAPVITSNVSSLPEVGGEAAAYVDPLDVQSITTTLRAVLTDESRRARMSAAGRARAAEFSWRRFAATTLDVLDEVAH